MIAYNNSSYNNKKVYIKVYIIIAAIITNH